MVQLSRSRDTRVPHRRIVPFRRASQSSAAFAQQAAARSHRAQPRRQPGPVRAETSGPQPRQRAVSRQWFRLRGEFRERMEGFDGLGFNDYARGSLLAESLPLQRDRHRLEDASASRRRCRTRASAKKTVGPTGTPFKAPFDLRMAFADVGAATGPVTIRAGRQELVYGEQRLVGHVSWLNAARTFDGVQGDLPQRRPSRSTSSRRRSSASSTASSTRAAPATASPAPTARRAKLIPQATVEPYVFFKRDVNLRAEAGGVRHAERDDDRRPHRRQAAGPPRLRRRDGAAARLARHRRRQRLGRPLAAARVAARPRPPYA